MRHALITSYLLLLAFCASAQTTSNVQTVRAWQRTHIMGVPGGTLLDPTGTLADAQRLAATQAAVTESSNLVAAANTGLTNALARLYAVTNRVSEFTGRLYIAADMDDDPDYENLQGLRVAETETNGVIHYFVHYTRELAAPPKTLWHIEAGGGSDWWVTGETETNNVLTNVLGYACYDIQVVRPAAAGNIVLRSHKFLKFGAPGNPLELPEAGLRIISGAATNTPFTGDVVFTNVTGAVTGVVTESYHSGFLGTSVTNVIGGGI